MDDDVSDDFKSVLKINNIDGEKLEQNLKEIGFTITSFTTKKKFVLDKGLIDIFGQIAEIELGNLNRVEKFQINELKTKLKQIQKKPLNNVLEISKEYGQAKNAPKLTARIPLQHRSPYANKKLGTIKAFKSDKGYGFIRSYDDNRDCFVHVSKLLTSNTNEGCIVIFETITSIRKPGELDAIKVSNKIPVFILNKESSPESFAYPLLANHLEKGILLNEKYETGFNIVSAYTEEHNDSWKISELTTEIVPKVDSIYYGKEIISKLLPKLAENKTTIDWLTAFLQPNLDAAEIYSIYRELISGLEQKSTIEIYKIIEHIKDNSYLKTFLEEKKKTFNKISFVLWTLGMAESLPKPTNEYEKSTWYGDILKSLNQLNLQDLLIKLLEEENTSQRVEEAYIYLIEQGWQIKNEQDLESAIAFVKKFRLAFPSISLNETHFKCTSIKFYIDLYYGEVINELSDELIKLHLNELKSNDKKNNFLHELLIKQGKSKQVEGLYRSIVEEGWQIDTKIQLQSAVKFLKGFISAFPYIVLGEENFTCKTNQFYIKLYTEGLIKELSSARIEQYIKELVSKDEKANFIESLSLEKALSLYKSFSSLSAQKKKYVDRILESEFSKIDFLCFDLESDGKKINEYAWKSRLSVKSQTDFKNQQDGISELVSLINSSFLIIGQNIKGFDLPVLAKHGSIPSSDFIWDTLEVEMLLNPNRFSYGLKATHNAVADTELTYQLFKNQLSRIIDSQSNLEAVKELLPSRAIDAINQIRSNPIWSLLEDDYFTNQSNEFFRPNPTNQHIPEQTFNQLNEQLNSEGNKVIIAPELLWNALFHQFDLAFYQDSEPLGLTLNKEKIEATIVDDKMLKAILFQFIESCTSKGSQPYFQRLPIAIRRKLTSQESTLICDKIKVEFGKTNQKTACIKPTDIEILKQLGSLSSDLKVIVLGNELYNLTSKLQLGQDLDFATIFDRLKNERIWLQMSGGKSFISLEQSHCIQLGITEFPDYVQNIWLEKTGKGKFKVWCNLDFEGCLAEILHANKVCHIGNTYSFQTLQEKLYNEPIWVPNRENKTYLTASHCEILGIQNVPKSIEKFWIEKQAAGEYKVCYLNLNPNFQNSFSIKKVDYIKWIDESFDKKNAFVIRANRRDSGYLAEQKRVNPESLYRKMYWVYQFKLFEGFGNTNNPKVLIVNDELETEKLSAYARRKGYFIPDTKASLARQVELLHTHRSPNKLLIASFLTLDKIISSNYTGPLDFIWDSFLLQEKLQMLKGKVNKDDIETTENANYIPSLKGDLTNKGDFDTYKLFRLHKPLVDYYYKMIIDNNQESNLFLCDTRLADFIGIEKSLELKSKHVRLWNRIEDYEADYKEASDFFPSDLLKDNDFDIVEAKQILRQLFLPKNDNGDFFEWYDYQDKCLDEILPAKKDLLISLPTGAGKSVLFQAPALFRSSFTNKLNIVISPLRALMHDQVEILHEMGLYSNVEYLSGDKSQEEIKDIYRRIVGGEIVLLYITPERFRSRSFENCLLTRLDADSGLEYVVFDEAHCISQWGQEFRPDYLNAARVIADKSKHYQMVKLLFSATISDQVAAEIETIMPGITPVTGTEKTYNPVRDHIKMDFRPIVIDDERLLETAKYIKSGNFNPALSRAIIFVKSRKKVEECTLIMPDILKEVFGANCQFADKVGSFHAAMDTEDRKSTYEKYKTGEIVILFATKAFGMGMDISNIHFVTHYSPPSTFEDFLQEVGRAGRDEQKRLKVGFDNNENPIKTICLTSDADFESLQRQLFKSRITWQEVKDVKQLLEEYIARFKPLTPDNEVPVAIPFNLYSNEKGAENNENDTKFRIGLHWLEKLGRIRLGYFTITHLEFETASLSKLGDRIDDCPDKDCKKVCQALIKLISHADTSNKVVQISTTSLRSSSKLGLEKLFAALLKNHAAGILKLIQDVIIEPTRLRTDEIIHYSKQEVENKYPALRIIFSFAREIMKVVPKTDSKVFEGDDLDRIIKRCIDENIHQKFQIIPWTVNPSTKSALKNSDKYCHDLFEKRSKHAFTIIRLLRKNRHTSSFEKIIDGNRKTKTIQTVYNGYNKDEEWLNKLARLEEDCTKVLDYVGKQYFQEGTKKYSWPNIISELGLPENIQYLTDLLFILSVLGYCKTGSLLPSGIEVFLNSIENINETITGSSDEKVHLDFIETQEIRLLKLIALRVLSTLEFEEQDAFIKGFFAAKNKKDLINHLEDKIESNHPILQAFRGDAIKYQERERLNDEQRLIYKAVTNRHINVEAGPGSGKTHTLTLRVARLIHHLGVNAEEILVLAYNRAVVSELKERLGKLFKELGYGNLAKRIKIFTFHGLAKKYCGEQIAGLEFKAWEPKLLEILNTQPGLIMNQLAPLKHILVDEFQDINEVRMDLLFRLNELTQASLFVIGDPNQSIYGYDRDFVDPYHYYEKFNKLFDPVRFTLLDNHRSYPKILDLAGKVLSLSEEHKHLIPKSTKTPDENFISDYAEVIDRTKVKVDWWDKIPQLLGEEISEIRNGNDEPKPYKYKQIAILFRTNNEVYRGFQRLKGLALPNVRIRIQGNLPYEFTRIRECHAAILILKSMVGQKIPFDFKKIFGDTINDLIKQNKNWNHFYLRVIHAIVLEYLDENDDDQLFDSLLEFITELTYKDDGQLYQIYEKHLDKISNITHETEIVLTTMHKVKGLEFDCVLIAPSFTELPMPSKKVIAMKEQLGEEKRLAFVAYTRARYRLMIFKHLREVALDADKTFKVDDAIAAKLGYAVKPELSKLFISWAALEGTFSTGLSNYLKNNIQPGDAISVNHKKVVHNGKVVGFLSASAFEKLPPTPVLQNFVVNEVVVWSYEETKEADEKNGTNYAVKWCQAAENQGYIYLVDFAGFGVSA